jgi:murein DD-endopeptidase MepM/ murein hydrolase activator NlpD
METALARGNRVTRSRHPRLFLLGLSVLAALCGPPALGPGAHAAGPAASDASPRLVQVRSGDTLMGVLVREGVAAADAQDAIASLRRVWDPRDLQVGQEIALGFDTARLREMRLTASLERDVIVTRDGDGRFASQARPRPLTRLPELATGTIASSLFETATDAGVPPPVLAEMIRAFSYDVDFQREVQPGDHFEVLYERIYDENGKLVGNGDIAYAAMILSGTALRLYRFAPAGGAAGFYTAQGESVRKALLRTPVDGARISSGFGLRHHPILGYTAMHRGVDFAVPMGTPIMAAGDGVVELAARSGGYGNTVVLHHTGVYETAYGHMSRFARGIKPGQRVRQGQVIGFVGSTGRSTGPHLHFEIRTNGSAINPLSVHMPPGTKLAGREQAAFAAVADTIERHLLALRHAPLVAVAPSPPGR